MATTRDSSTRSRRIRIPAGERQPQPTRPTLAVRRIPDLCRAPTGPQNGVYYAFSYVWSPTDRRAHAALAVADSVKLWLNGKLEFAHHSHPPFVNLRDPWSHRPALELKQGWNTLLLKIGPASAGATGFLFRLTDAANNTLRDLVYAKEPSLPAASSRAVRLTAGHPPGTAGQAISPEMDEREIPERPYVFQPKTTTTELFCWTDTPLANYSGTALYETTFTLASCSAGQTRLSRSRPCWPGRRSVDQRQAGRLARLDTVRIRRHQTGEERRQPTPYPGRELRRRLDVARRPDLRTRRMGRQVRVRTRSLEDTPSQRTRRPGPAVGTMMTARLILALAAAAYVHEAPRQFERSRDYDVEHYRIELRFDEKTHSFWGETRVSLWPLKDGFEVCELDAETFAVTAVRDDVGALRFEQKPGKLVVRLRRPHLYRDKTAFTVVLQSAERECGPREVRHGEGV